MSATKNSDGTFTCSTTGTRFQTRTGDAPTTPTVVYTPGGYDVAGTWTSGQVKR